MATALPRRNSPPTCLCSSSLPASGCCLRPSPARGGASRRFLRYRGLPRGLGAPTHRHDAGSFPRSEEHTSELQSLAYLVCRLLLEKKKKLATASLRDLGVADPLKHVILMRNHDI